MYQVYIFTGNVKKINGNVLQVVSTFTRGEKEVENKVKVICPDWLIANLPPLQVNSHILVEGEILADEQGNQIVTTSESGVKFSVLNVLAKQIVNLDSNHYQKLITAVTVARDSELRYTANGKPVLTFGGAANTWDSEKAKLDSQENRNTPNEERYKNQRTTWMKFTQWGREATEKVDRTEKLVAIIKKGLRVLITGSVSFNEKGFLPTWEVKDSPGSWKSNLDINVRDLTFLGGGNSGKYKPTATAGWDENVSSEETDDESEGPAF